ncbi:MAG: UDP-N-acetylmuramate--L-alanine ligase [Candidatus Pacebacteria bacterium]|nr:UDP-N-acetylmuramate--L-alanine ligase [Candidatus Paceibacterota bacterium]
MITKKSSAQASRKIVHFVGIGGIGVSALARYFLSQNWAVSGSDAARHVITDGLKKDAINVKIGHKRANVPPDTSIIIKSQAIPGDNPEIKEAARRGIKVLSYPEALGSITRQYRTIAIAGSHGKSTTTALAALLLIRNGLDPTVVIGNNLKEFGGQNFRIGKSDWLVIEADEYGRAFYHYSPSIAMVTNIDREHLDIYKNITDAKNAFMHFLANTVAGGALILNRDDKNLRSLKTRIAALAKRKKLRVIWYSAKDPSTAKIEKVMKIFGTHNLSNAESVYQLGTLLGFGEKNTLAAIGSYRGAWRRMEYRGTMKLGGGKAPVYDDYAHHPTEIKATLRAIKEQFPKQPLICVFQPHQTKRLELLFKEFTGAFDDADITMLLPIYRVRGRDEAGSQSSESLTEAIRRRDPDRYVVYVERAKDLPAAVKDFYLSSPFAKKDRSPVIVMMGAGDVVNATASLIK